MIINKGKPVSLSMRMRTEAAKLPPERQSSARGSNMSESGSLPDIGGGSGIFSSNTSQQKTRNNLTLGLNYSLTQKKNPGSQEIEMEKASGIKDYLESGAVFADRTKMTMPTASCVRCGEHASTCMSCTEYLAEESLNFYRKTRARGAASLFANAITQTGVTTVVKYIIYSLWKNSYYIRKWAMKKRAFKAEILCRKRYMSKCYKAWSDYRTMNKVDRRDKEIERLTKRVAALEAATTQATNLQKNAEAQLGKVQKEKNGFLATIDEQALRIEGLELLVLKERQRVVGLSTLSLPILNYNNLTAVLSEKGSKDIHRKLFLAAASQQPAYEYGKAINAEDLDQLIDDEDSRRRKKKRFKAEELDEDVEVVGMLFNWVSSKSRDAGSNMDSTSGKTLDTILPKYKKLNTFDDFKNGSIFLRLVVGLLWDMPQKGHTTLKLATTKLVPDGLQAPVSVNDENNEEVTNENVFDHVAVLGEIKKSLKTPFDMITCAVELAQKFLAFPAFQVGDIMSCRVDIMTAIIGYLMLASASPAQSTGSLAKVSSIIHAYEKANGKAEYARRQIELKKVENIKNAWAVLHGIEKVAESAEEVDAAAVDNSVVIDAVSESKDQEPVEESKTGSGSSDDPDSESKVEGNVEVIVSEADVGKDDAVDAAPAEKQTEGLSKYSSLANAVDDYLGLLGEVDNDNFTFEKLEGPIVGQLNDYQEVMRELDEVQLQVDDHLVKVDQGFKLANKARLTVNRFQMELLCSELSWLA
jgi:hypothetical protein